MFINILAFICSLAIAAVAAYYSIIGLTSIFAAAIIPVAIMGGVLEAGKLITATWLYDNWKNTPFLLKSYLTLSVVLLMFITSMGIFGFLSKAHIEQTAGAKDGLAKIERIDEDIARLKTAIARSEEKIITIGENAFANNDAIQEQLDKEQLRINNAYARVEPQINEQLAIIETENSNRQKRIASFEADIESLDNELIRLVALTNQYRKELNNVGDITFQENLSDTDPNCWLFTFRTKKMRDLLNYLNANKIQSRPFWTPMNKLPMYKNLLYISENNISNKIFKECITIPCSSNLSIIDQETVITEIKKFYKS